MAVSGSFPGHLWAAFHGRLHPDKDERIVHRPDPQICGPANELAEYGEVSGGSFPRVR